MTGGFEKSSLAGLGRRGLLGGLGGLGLLSCLVRPSLSFAAERSAAAPRILLLSKAGRIVIEVDIARAPITARHFMALAERGVFAAGASFYRSVAPARDVNPVPITVVQGGIGAAMSPLPAIAHESTASTGLRHRDGTISMARAAPGTASTEFFICLGDNPELDHGGKRAPDGEGFAAFGQVVAGMDVVRRIHAMPVSDAGAGTAVARQLLAEPVAINGLLCDRGCNRGRV